MPVDRRVKALRLAGLSAAVLAVFVAILVTDPPAPVTADRPHSPEPSPARPAGALGDRPKAAVPGPVPAPGVEVPPGSAWIEVAVADVHPGWIPAYHEVVEDARLVALTGDFGVFAAGDTITLPVPQVDRVFTPTIDSVQTLLGTNRSYVGRTIGRDVPLSFVVTVGDRNTFAFVDTAAGSYELVGNTRFGWLMPTAGMDTHVDYSVPDYIIPGRTP